MFGTKIMKIFYQCKETAILVMYMVYINTMAESISKCNITQLI